MLNTIREMNTISIIGSYLRQIRKDKGLKQSTVCKAVEISQNYLSQIENELKTPSVDVLDRLLIYYEVTVSLHYKH